MSENREETNRRKLVGRHVVRININPSSPHLKTVRSSSHSMSSLPRDPQIVCGCTDVILHNQAGITSTREEQLEREVRKADVEKTKMEEEQNRLLAINVELALENKRLLEEQLGWKKLQEEKIVWKLQEADLIRANAELVFEVERLYVKEERWKEETTCLWRQLDKARERLEEYNAMMQTWEEEEEEALTFLQALDNKDRGKVRQRPEQYNNNAQMQTLDEEEEALCLQKALDDFNAKFQEKREIYKTEMQTLEEEEEEVQCLQQALDHGNNEAEMFNTQMVVEEKDKALCIQRQQALDEIRRKSKEECPVYGDDDQGCDRARTEEEETEEDWVEFIQSRRSMPNNECTRDENADQCWWDNDASAGVEIVEHGSTQKIYFEKMIEEEEREEYVGAAEKKVDAADEGYKDLKMVKVDPKSPKIEEDKMGEESALRLEIIFGQLSK